MYPRKIPTVDKPLPKVSLHPTVCVIDVTEEVIQPDPEPKYPPEKNDAAAPTLDFGDKPAAFLKHPYGETQHISVIIDDVLREVVACKR